MPVRVKFPSILRLCPGLFNQPSTTSRAFIGPDATFSPTELISPSAFRMAFALALRPVCPNGTLPLAISRLCFRAMEDSTSLSFKGASPCFPRSVLTYFSISATMAAGTMGRVLKTAPALTGPFARAGNADHPIENGMNARQKKENAEKQLCTNEGRIENGIFN